MSESRLTKVERPRAAGWSGLLIAPLAALAVLSVGHALVTPSCAWDTRLWLHAAFSLFTFVAAAATWGSVRAWRRAAGRRPGEHGGDGSQQARDRFIALLGTACGAYFTVVILAQWAAVAVLSPCAS